MAWFWSCQCKCQQQKPNTAEPVIPLYGLFFSSSLSLFLFSFCQTTSYLQSFFPPFSLVLVIFSSLPISVHHIFILSTNSRSVGEFRQSTKAKQTFVHEIVGDTYHTDVKLEIFPIGKEITCNGLFT